MDDGGGNRRLIFVFGWKSKVVLIFDFISIKGSWKGSLFFGTACRKASAYFHVQQIKLFLYSVSISLLQQLERNKSYTKSELLKQLLESKIINRVQEFYYIQQMKMDDQRLLDQIEPIIKVVKDRQSIFFDLLTFVNKNIQSSSNEIDQITIFTKCITIFSENQKPITEKEFELVKSLSPSEDQGCEGYKIPNTSKQMIRLSGRILQILQSSVEKSRNSLFNQNGRLIIDYSRFKKNLHKIIQQSMIQILDFVQLITNFTRNKFKRQIIKIKNYLQKLKDGQCIRFRQMYNKNGSDIDQSPDEKKQKIAKQHRIPKKQSARFFKQEDFKDPEIQAKKSVLKRPDASKSKRNSHNKSSKKEKEGTSLKGKDQEAQISKSSTANALLKFYAPLQLNKKQFLQDYVFEKHEQEKHRKRLMTQLLQRNKANGDQIVQYSYRCQNFSTTNLLVNISSDEKQGYQSSANSKASIKTSFMISKRKPSFTADSGGSEKSDFQNKNQPSLPFSKTIKNMAAKRRSSEEKHIKQNLNRSKKIFVVKSPLNFDDDILPKAHLTQVGWAALPLTNKDSKSRRNEGLRLKKRNNPMPMDEKFLPDSFRNTDHGI